MSESSIPASDRRCGVCRFWVTDDAPPTMGGLGKPYKAGECHRFPPQSIGDDPKSRNWPAVYDFDWCGEWQGPDEETARLLALLQANQ